VGTQRPLLGVAARFTVHHPRPVQGGHSLAELAVAGDGPEREGIEVGWRVSPLLEGDDRPHLFVHRWRSGEPCWTDCRFVPWSGRWAPGDALDEVEGREVSMGIAVADGQWWIWFDGEWLGAFDVADWEGRLALAGTAHWYGEVFAPGPAAAGEMGNGAPGTDPAAARIERPCQVFPETWSCSGGAFLYPVVSEPQRYPVRMGNDGLRYGGGGPPGG
jgi:Neprosin